MLKHKKGLIVLLIASALCLSGAISAMFSKGECKHVYDERTNICKKCGEDGPDPEPYYPDDDDGWTDLY